MPLSEVLGINRRNIEYVLALNPRKYFSRVDDKLETKSILNAHGIPSATLLGSTDSFFGIAPFLDRLAETRSFVLKPGRGSGGSGIVVVRECLQGRWKLTDGTTWDREEQQDHVENILYGTFSLDSAGDTAFAEELIECHPDLSVYSGFGLPDVRIILLQGRPVLSMLRAPTRQSRGKANLHAGGFAVAIDLDSGLTGEGWHHGGRIGSHPETGEALGGKFIPHWRRLLEISRELFTLFPLGYMGVDFALDVRKGPLILELNARPGLEIQNVTGTGLRPRLEGRA